jgi:hypothetical protein
VGLWRGLRRRKGRGGRSRDVVFGAWHYCSRWRFCWVWCIERYPGAFATVQCKPALRYFTHKLRAYSLFFRYEMQTGYQHPGYATPVIHQSAILAFPISGTITIRHYTISTTNFLGLILFASLAFGANGICTLPHIVSTAPCSASNPRPWTSGRGESFSLPSASAGVSQCCHRWIPSGVEPRAGPQSEGGGNVSN